MGALRDGFGWRGRTVRMRTQRRTPAMVTKIPPLNMMISRYFLLVGMRAFHSS